MRLTLLHLFKIWIQSGNHGKLFWQASSGRKTQPRRRNQQTATILRGLLRIQKLIQLNFVKHLRIFPISSSKISRILWNFCAKSPIWKKQFRNLNIFCGKDQHLLEYQISWDFATKIVNIFRKWFSKSNKSDRIFNRC